MAPDSVRGGAKRKPVADVDNEDLYNVFEEHVESVGASKALFLGRYSFIARSHAVDAAGLSECSSLIKKAFFVFPLFSLIALSWKEFLWCGKVIVDLS